MVMMHTLAAMAPTATAKPCFLRHDFWSWQISAATAISTSDATVHTARPD